MKKEIKEILDKLNKIVSYANVPKELAYMTTSITSQECKLLLDYITNLQDIIKQRNKDIETLLKTVKVSEKKIKDLQEENETLKNQLDFIEEQNHIIKKLEEEIEKLKREKIQKELCESLLDECDAHNKFLQEELKITKEKWEKDKQWSECRTKEWLEYKLRNEKAIEYLANCDWNCKDFENLYDILGGNEE